MGLIHIEMFATLDLVGQAPGGPDEDPEGFPFGGWQAPLMDEVAGAQVGAAYEGTDALLLGRRTYDIFAAYWPHQEGGEDDEIATLFNSVPKYVASRGTPDLSWAGSTQLGPDLAGAVREIRDRHEHVKVVGSLNLVQTLLREKLFDRLDLWVHPIVLGVGKKVFDGGAVPTNLTLLEPPVAGPKGTVYLRYGLADGTPATGDMTPPSEGGFRPGRDQHRPGRGLRRGRPGRRRQTQRWVDDDFILGEIEPGACHRPCSGQRVRRPGTSATRAGRSRTLDCDMRGVDRVRPPRQSCPRGSTAAERRPQADRPSTAARDRWCGRTRRRTVGACPPPSNSAHAVSASPRPT